MREELSQGEVRRAEVPWESTEIHLMSTHQGLDLVAVGIIFVNLESLPCQVLQR